MSEYPRRDNRGEKPYQLSDAALFVSQNNMKAQKNGTALAKTGNGKSNGPLRSIPLVTMSQLAAFDDEAQRRGTTAPELIHEAHAKNQERKSASEFRQWLEQTPEAATIEGMDFPRVKCAVKEIELDVIDWMRVLKLSRTNGQSIEYTLEMLLEKALEK